MFETFKAWILFKNFHCNIPLLLNSGIKHSNNCNFIIRMLYWNAYWQSF